jgi:CRP/FNR family transcriptional regulator, cyclic AMP receptor protein
MTDDRIDPSVVQRTGLFAGLDDDDIASVLAVGEEVTFEADQPIFEQGDRGDGLFVMLEGEARVDVGGRFHVLKAGDFFGEMAVIAPGPRMATVRATESVRAAKIPSDAFASFLLEHPQIAFTMLKAVVLRLREVEQRVESWMA